MYIPMHVNETMRVEVPAPNELTLILRPVTGESDYFLAEIFATEVKTPLDASKQNTKILDYFVKGYVMHDENRTEKMFDEGEKPSDYLGFPIKNWLAGNIHKINQLTEEEKKI